MREERVIALAGALQATSLVRSLALSGDADAASTRISLASIFKIDADNAADVFGGVAQLRHGLEMLVAQIESGKRDPALTRLLINVMRVEGVLARRSDVLDALRTGIEEIARGDAMKDDNPVDATSQLARLYSETLSTLKPRIMVEGSPRFLNNAQTVDSIRALLLAAVRATVLWRQLGGSQLRLFFRHRQYAMLARGLLAQCTLSGG
jgi:high frequency lysogenization protein